MNVILWIIAIVLAVVFLMAGLAKVSQPKEKLAEKMGWVEDWSPNAVKLIGAVEILGAIGLVLPAATGVATVLTPLAATGLAIVMLLAAVVHARRKEQQLIAVNVVLLVLAAFVAVMRFGPQAF